MAFSYELDLDFGALVFQHSLTSKPVVLVHIEVVHLANFFKNPPLTTQNVTARRWASETHVSNSNNNSSFLPGTEGRSPIAAVTEKNTDTEILIYENNKHRIGEYIIQQKTKLGAQQ